MRLNDKRFVTFILALAAIGILYRLFTHPSGMLIPVLVLGTAFLLYKYPPARWRRFRLSRRHPDPRKPAGPRHKTRNRHDRPQFRVIRGNKKDGPHH